METKLLTHKIAERILEVSKGRRYTRIGFDGVDTAGKTTLADFLAKHELFKDKGVIRGSIDGFHNPRALRYARGKESPEGYYNDSFQYSILKQHLLEPLGPRGTGVYRRSVFDYRSNKVVNTPKSRASTGSILLFDGVFLAREETLKHWELLIFLRVSFDEALKRALERDTRIGSRDEISHVYTTRYIPGQKLYFSEAHPEKRAHVVIDNEDYTNPKIVKW